MNENLAPLEAPPPPPPPRKSKTGLIVGIVAGVLVLCLCCVAVGVVIYVERNNIPAISGLFATPTPQGVSYSSSSMNLSLYYPPSWTYEESDGAVVFATSQNVIDSSDFPASGAALAILRDESILSSLATGVDASSPEQILSALLDPNSSFFGDLGTVLEPVRSYVLGGNPAASAAYTFTSTGSPVLVGYFAVIVPAGTPIIIIGICPQSEWATHHPTFDGILASMDIQSSP
jgi:hypothetical protein